MTSIIIASTLVLPTWGRHKPTGPDPSLFPPADKVAVAYRNKPHPSYPEKRAKARRK